MIPLIMDIVIMVGVVTVTVTAAPADEQFYASRYDHLDIEHILNNRRMVNYYAACLLSKGPCPPQGVEFKRILPEALQTNCLRCTEKQKTVTYRTIKRLKKEYPKIWAQLVKLWDPDDIYVRKFESSFESQAKVPPTPASPPILLNRFGDEPETNPPPPSTSSTTTTSTTTITTTKITNKPTSSVIIIPPQAPPYTTVGANQQTTVTFSAALNNIVIQLYQLKLDLINRILSGR